jgi:hypothetical protein
VIFSGSYGSLPKARECCYVSPEPFPVRPAPAISNGLQGQRMDTGRADWQSAVRSQPYFREEEITVCPTQN